MRHVFNHARICAAAWALAGCTVAIPDLAHFPEGRDTQTEDAVLDASDATGKDAKTDVADAKDAVVPDIHDIAPDVPDIAPDAGLDVQPLEIAEDVTTDVADTVTETQDAAAVDADAADAAGDVAVDVGPSCTPSQCDDGNACTLDDCDLAGECTHTSLAGQPCPDDGLPCTGDSCLGTICSHTTLLPNWCIVAGQCYAGGTFTSDACAVCDPASTPVAWTPLPDTTTCTDGTVCTVGDHCAAGACLPGTVTTCDDGNACTADVCDAKSGCSNANLQDGAGCPAVGVCKLPGYCTAGSCASSPKLWSTSLDGGMGGDDQFNAVATTPAGEIIAVGARTGVTWQEGWAVHLDAASDLVENLPTLADPAANAHYSSVAVAADGSLALGGATSTDAIVQLVHANGIQSKVLPFAKWGAGDVTTLVAQGTGWLALDKAGHIARLTDTGATVWMATADAFGPSVLRDVVGLPDGGALAVGSCAGLVADAATALMVRYSAAGAVLWQRAFGSAGSNFSAVTVAADGSAYVTGSRPNGAASSRWFGHTTADGAWLGGTLWSPGALTAISDGVVAPDGTWRFVATQGPNVWEGAFDLLGNLQWQKTEQAGTAHDLALLAGGGAVIAGQTPAPADGLILRVDPWGENDCAVSQLCSNLTLSACTDGLACTTDVCTAGGTCSHAPLAAVPCDDGDVCTVIDACAAGQCSAGVDGLFDSTDSSVTAWSDIAAVADGGAVVTGPTGTVARLDASGATVWSHAVTGAITDVAVLPNAWIAVLQGDSGGAIWRFTDTGSAIAGAVSVDGASGGKSNAIAVLRDDAIVVVGTSDVGLPAQTAFVERFDAAWNGVSTTLPGSFGLSSGLAVAAAASGGCGVLTVEGTVAKIHRLDATLQEVWAKPLGVATLTSLAAMPDGGWIAAGLGPKGVAVERYGPDGVFEFTVQWPVSGLTDVRAVSVLPDGTSAVVVDRLVGGVSQGGVARLGPLGSLLSLSWGASGSQLSDVATVALPSGVWAVGSQTSGGWLRRSDSHGGLTCASSGGCVSESLICDDGNPCTDDGCAAGKCTIAAPATPRTCLDGGVCSSAGACPLLGTCGDGKCNIKETSSNCPGDCPASCDTLVCDDGDPCTIDFCQAGTCAIGGASDGTACALGQSCVLGQCGTPICGDGICESAETATECPADCPVCGNGVCSAGENNHVCPADCAKPASGCQNMCGWKSQKPGGGLCWCDVNCTPGPFGDCCDDKATFCP